MDEPNKFEAAISGLDTALFSHIPTQSTPEDQHSLLACQLAVRELCGTYRYLEIGSYLGGSLQPHLADPRCMQIVSIDRRPPSQPDERGFAWEYRNNSTRRMLDGLSAAGYDTTKISTVDGDTREIESNSIQERFDLFFIDGEHTDAAALADFRFCRSHLAGRGAVVFHDAQITYNAISEAIEELRADGVPFKAYALPNAVFVVEIGDFPLHRHAKIASLLVENHASYLYALRQNDGYRRFANRMPFRLLRRLALRFRGGNVSE